MTKQLAAIGMQAPFYREELQLDLEHDPDETA
jgi:hypothetical protein